MNFMDAIQLLKQGKMVVRDSWGEDIGYLKLMYGMPYVWRIIVNPANAGSFSFSVDEICAEDWVEFPKPVREPINDPEIDHVISEDAA